MKRQIIHIVAFIACAGLLATFAAGCSRSASTETKQAEPAAKSTTDTVIEGITGKTAVDAGRKARATLEDIGAQRDEEYKAIAEME